MPSPLNLADAVATGNRRVSLEAIRSHLVDQIGEASPREVAALTKLLVDVIREVDNLPVLKVGIVDELVNARLARQRKTKAAKRPEVGDVSSG